MRWEPHGESRREQGTQSKSKSHQSKMDGGELAQKAADCFVRVLAKKRKEHCRLPRLWACGHLNGKHAQVTPNVMEEALAEAVKECIGDQESVQQLYNLWVKLEEDFSNVLHRLFGDESECTLEKLMYLIWPAAGEDDISLMRSWCNDFQEVGVRKQYNGREPMPLLSRELEGLKAVFRKFDKLGTGEVSIEMLRKSAVVQPYQLADFTCRHDIHKTVFIDVMTFCDLMCPAGVDSNGQRVMYNDVSRCWHSVELPVG